MNAARTPVPDDYEVCLQGDHERTDRLPSPLGADAAFWDPVRAVMGSHSSLAFDLPGHGSAPPSPAGAGIERQRARRPADRRTG